MRTGTDSPSKPQRGRTAVRLFGTLFFGVFALVGGMGTYLFGKSAWNSVQPHFWQRTPCTIVESQAAGAALERTSKDGAAFTLRYSYDVGGKEYTSGMVRTDGLNREGWNTANLLSKYRKGDKTTCWVDPGNPAVAVLERESPWLALVPLFPFVFFAIGAGGIIGVWRLNLNAAGVPMKKKRKPSAGFGSAMSILFVVIGLFFLGLLVGLPGQKLWRAQSWAETPCTVLSSRVISSRGSKSTTYRPEITYSYRVNGRDYVSAEYDLFGVSSSGRKGKDAVVRRFKPGSETVCYVDSHNPSEAVLNRAPSPILLLGIIPLILIAIGSVGLAKSRKDAGAGGRISDPVPGGVPVLPSSGSPDGRMVLKSQASPLAKFIGAFCVAAFWNGIVSVFVYQLVTGWVAGKREWFLGVFLLPFEAIGLLLLVATAYCFLNLFNPRIRMTVTSDAVPLGGVLDVRWETRGAVGRIRRLRMTLEGMEKTKRGSGKNSTREESLFAKLPMFETDDTTRMRAGSARLNIPVDTMHSFDGGDNQIEWKLKVSGEIARYPDVEDEFSISLSPART
jgi:hypothetical protein